MRGVPCDELVKKILDYYVSSKTLEFKPGQARSPLGVSPAPYYGHMQILLFFMRYSMHGCIQLNASDTKYTVFPKTWTCSR